MIELYKGDIVHACVQLGYRETKGLRHLLWIRLCRAIDIHIIWVVIMPC